MTRPGRPLVMSSGKLAHTKPAPSRPSSLIPSPRIHGSHPGPGGSRQSRKSLRSPPDAPARDNDAMASELIRCGHCGQKNRVPAAAAGTPRCGKCHQRLPWIADADDTTFGDVAEAAKIPVIVDLWAPWCGPCRRVSPALEQLARDLAGRVKLVKVNVDVSPQVSRRFGAQAIPTLLVLRDGRVAARQTGAAPMAALRAWVEDTLATAGP
jgi:thioredoxin 2